MLDDGGETSATSLYQPPSLQGSNHMFRTQVRKIAPPPPSLALPPMALLPVLISITAIFLAYKHYQRLRFKLPPGPRSWPIVGNLHQIKPVRFRCFAEWAQSYGPIISVWFGSTLNVVVSSSELAKEVLKEKDKQLADRYRTRSFAGFSRDGKDLIWSDYGPHYVKLRKVCTVELLSNKRLEALRPIRQDEVTAVVESIFKDVTNPENVGKSIVLRKCLGEVTLNNITRMVLGKRFMNSEGVLDEQGLEFKAIGAEGLKISASLTMAEHIPWLRWMFPLEDVALDRLNTRRHQLTRVIMEEHTLAGHNTGGAKQHFVDALLTLKDKYDLSEDTISALLWDMIIAAMDTTAISVEWALAEVVKNPRVQQKVQAELDNVIGLDRFMTESDFSDLPYLRCVVKEALRLHPPTPLMLPHRANTNVKIGGYDIPKGSVIQVNVWAVARDPTIWKDPEEFQPERFLVEDVDIKGHDFRLLPFGAGRRACPGAHLGFNLITLILGHLLHHFNWAPPQGVNPKDLDMSDSLGLGCYMKTPLQSIPTPRLSATLYKRMTMDI